MLGAQTFREFEEGEDEMKISAVMRWVGPAAIVGGVFMMFSDLLNLTIYVPGLGEATHTGYQAVGSGVILFALTLMLVGMVGLYARQPSSTGARVIESGTGYPRYDDPALTQEDVEERQHPAGRDGRARREREHLSQTQDRGFGPPAPLAKRGA
jgi:hypothetical protein